MQHKTVERSVCKAHRLGFHFIMIASHGVAPVFACGLTREQTELNMQAMRNRLLISHHQLTRMATSGSAMNTCRNLRGTVDNWPMCHSVRGRPHEAEDGVRAHELHLVLVVLSRRGYAAASKWVVIGRLTGYLALVLKCTWS